MKIHGNFIKHLINLKTNAAKKIYILNTIKIKYILYRKTLCVINLIFFIPVLKEEEEVCDFYIHLHQTQSLGNRWWVANVGPEWSKNWTRTYRPTSSTSSPLPLSRESRPDESQPAPRHRREQPGVSVWRTLLSG